MALSKNGESFCMSQVLPASSLLPANGVLIHRAGILRAGFVLQENVSQILS